MTFNVNPTNEQVVISQGENSITLKTCEIEEIMRRLYRPLLVDDVRHILIDKIMDGELPPEAFDNKEFLEALTDKYIENRTYAEGTDRYFNEVIKASIVNAFEDISYETFA